MQRYFKAGIPIYDNIESIFEKNDVQQLDTYIQQNTDTLISDGNFGIAKQLSGALTRHRIRLLTSTYMTLSLQDIATSVGLSGPAEAEKYLVLMSDKYLGFEPISVKIDQLSGMATFDENQDSHSTPEITTQMMLYIKQSEELSNEIRKLQRAVITSHEYVSRVNAVAGTHGSLSSSVVATGSPMRYDDDCDADFY